MTNKKSRHACRASALSLGVALLLSPAMAQTPGAPPPYVAPSAAPAGQAQTISTPQGRLKGSVADGVAWFLGIPFAPPPVGELRWRPPGAPPGWSGERDATKAGSTCFAAEDCLYLNVLRPASAKASQKLPVMVWIHGGAFLGGSSMGGYGGDTDGHEFAKKGIVAVSVNYRLGRAGWFAHPALDKEGHPHSNYGAMDQIAALKWVKANIGQFGGDPNNVTIFGESAGGFGVLLLMVAPDAKGLFNKVIAESSFGRTLTVPLADAEAAGLRLAASAGVTGEDAAAAAALRKIPFAALPPIPPRGSGGRGDRPYPILDGTIFTTDVMPAFLAGREARVPLMVGGNSNEASLTRPTPALFDAMPAERRDTILKVFDAKGTGDKAQIINDFVTVQGVTEPDRALVRLHTRNGAPSWTYYFSNVAEGLKAQHPYGAAHTEELPFVFIAPKTYLGPADIRLAGAVNAYWAAFAKTGDPDSAGGAPWPRWDNDREGQIEFAPDGAKTREHFLKSWRDTAESMVDGGANRR